MTSPSELMRSAAPRPPSGALPDVDGMLKGYAAGTAVTASADLVRRFHERLAVEPAPTPARSFVGAVGRLEGRNAWRAFGQALSVALGSGQAASRLRFQSLAVVLAVVLAVGGAAGGAGSVLLSVVRRPGNVTPGHPLPTQTMRPIALTVAVGLPGAVTRAHADFFHDAQPGADVVSARHRCA